MPFDSGDDGSKSCHLVQETKVQMRVDDMAGNSCQALSAGKSKRARFAAVKKCAVDHCRALCSKDASRRINRVLCTTHACPTALVLKIKGLPSRWAAATRIPCRKCLVSALEAKLR
jgi:hypothetical protein